MPHLQFKGKVLVENHHLSVPFHELTPVREKGRSTRASLHGNLIIHGDNLAALKSLLPFYRGKVKCVYIDPPYNTGNEGWAYNDNVNSSLIQDWLGKAVDRDDLTRHDKWLCMMMPRLKLLRELLREDGVIFVSIDDNEVHHLRCLMDEVFGEGNFFVTLCRRAMHTVRNSSKDFNLNADFILVYARQKEWFATDKSRYIRQLVDKSRAYPHDDNDGRGPYKLDPIHARNYYTPYTHEFKDGTLWSAPSGSYPRYSRTTLAQMETDGRIVFGGKEPMAKRYLCDVQEGRPPDAFLDSVNVGFNKDGTGELSEIFGTGGIFPQPKPTKLIRFLLGLLRDPEAIVLDSFAGSGTTAHAVLAQNQEDGGNRRFILVECEDYADSITAERVRRVIKGVANAKDKALRAGLDGSHLPSWEKLASYVFFTATGQEFNPDVVNRNTGFIGQTVSHDVFLFYEPDVGKLKNLALSLSEARALPAGSRKKLVFAPAKYLDREFLHKYRIDFQQLPFQVYQAMDRGKK